MKNLIIVGASSFGKEVAWLVERINTKNNEWNLLGFLDDNLDIQGNDINSYKVIGTINDVSNYKDCYFVVAVGSAKLREKLVNKVLNILPEAKFATLIDPTVEMSNLVNVGEGTIICSLSVLTVNITLGKHVIINLNCTIGHDAILNDFVTLYPSANVSGKVEVGKCCELGTGSQIIQGKKIGAGSILGAGSIVVRDIPENCTAVGSPAKPIKFFKD